MIRMDNRKIMKNDIKRRQGKDTLYIVMPAYNKEINYMYWLNNH